MKVRQLLQKRRMDDITEQILSGKGFADRHTTVDVLSKVMPHAASPEIATALATRIQQKGPPPLSSALRIAYIVALGRMPEHAALAVPALITQLENRSFSHWHAREAAAKALGRLGLASIEALPGLRLLAEHGDVEAVRTAAAKAAATIADEVAGLN